MYEPSRSTGPDSKNYGPDVRMPQPDAYSTRPKPVEKEKANPFFDLIETEKQFTEDLKCLLQRVTSCWGDEFPPAELDTMFRLIEQVYKQNKKFCIKLVKIGVDPQAVKDLGNALIAWVDDMKDPYTQYCQNYRRGFDNWPMIENHELLQQTLISATAERNRPVSLDYFFEMPLSRLQYYKKFYTRLLKSTEPGRSDNKILTIANQRLDDLLKLEKQARLRPILLPNASNKSLPLPPLPATPKLPKANESSMQRSAEAPLPLPPLPAGPKLPKANESSMQRSTEAPLPLPPLPAGPKLPKANESSMQRSTEAPLPLPPLPAGPKLPTPPSKRDDFLEAVTWNFGLEELDEQLDTSQVKDLFTKEQKKFKVALRPQNLAFQRDIRIHDNFIVVIQYQDEPVMHKAHLFLLTDLLLICRVFNAEERLQNPNKEFSLLYPPLSGKHLAVRDLHDPKDDILELVVMKKEKLILRAETVAVKNKWLSEFSQAIDFATKVGVQPQVNTDPRSLKRMPTNPQFGSPHMITDLKRTPSNPQFGSPRSPQIITDPRSLKRMPSNPQFGNSPLSAEALKRRPSAGNVPYNSRGNQRVNNSSPVGTQSGQIPPLPPLPPGYDRPLPPVKSNKGLPSTPNAVSPVQRSRTPEPFRNAHGDNYNQNSGRGPYPNDNSRALNRLRSKSIASLASVASIASVIETLYKTPPCETFYWRDNTWRPLTTKDLCIVEVRLTSANKCCWALLLRESRRMVLNAWLLPSTTLHRESPTDVSILCEMGSKKEYYRVNTPHPIEADRLISNLTKAKQYGIEYSFSQQGRGMQNLGVPAQQQIFVSRSSSLQSQQEPVREVEQTITQIMVTRCRVFLQNDHGVWTNLNWGHMELSLETPSHRKRITISSDKLRSKLIDAIVWEDGVERVGRTGIAITLNNMDLNFKAVYMLQMKEEKMAIKAFELMKEKKVKQ